MKYLFLLLPLKFVFISMNAKAQLCTGSLGDPAVSISFNNTGAAVVPGYVFTSSSCPSDGFYTIASSIANCFNNTWHSIASDHTGGGNFMLVNASFLPGDFFVQTVADLCPNTTYEFAAWVMNVLHRPDRMGIKPNLSFKIEAPDGTVLKDFQTGDIAESPAPEWRQYGFYFTTPANNAPVVLRITNNAPGGIGNDLALDDITFRPCGASIGANIQGHDDTVNVCEDNIRSYAFRGNVSSVYQQPAYQWQLSIDKGASWKDITGATLVSYEGKPAAPGYYWYRLTVLEAKDLGVLSCRIASNIVAVNIHAAPDVHAGPDLIIISGNTTTLMGKAAGEGLEYSWSPEAYINDTKTLVPTINPASDIVYTLTAKSKFGCSNADEVFVKVVADIFIPNAFTPNGDGKNDTWKIPFLDPMFGGEVRVFNRYGETVYHSKAAVVSWDGTIKGKQQPSGTYVYIVTIGPGSFRKVGTVTLIR